MLSGNWVWDVPQGFLDALSHLYGPTLEGILWNEQGVKKFTLVTPEFFASFQSLRVLDLRHVIGSKLPSSPLEPKPTLPHVTELVLSDTFTSLSFASALRLPAFHRLTIELANGGEVSRESPREHLKHFLKTHGPQLTQLELSPSPAGTEWVLDAALFLRPDHCWNLRDLVFHESYRPLDLPEPHVSLRRIGLRGVVTDHLYPDKSTSVTKHLKSFMSGMFPSLEVVRTVSFLVDAAVDCLSRDLFIWWAERLERSGIDLQDGEGVLWMYMDSVPEPAKTEPSKTDTAKTDEPPTAGNVADPETAA
jgi:hypothetical protein